MLLFSQMNKGGLACLGHGDKMFEFIRALCFILFWCVFHLTLAQNNNFSKIDRILSLFSNVFPQEKVYLHLDNTGYFRGETIWFAAYIVRTDGVQEDLSKTLYVELLNPVGEVFETQKLHIENGRAHGQIELKNKPVPTGFYEIRAYTRYMLNWDAAGIFSRVIPIFKEIKGEDENTCHSEMTHLEVLNRMNVAENHSREGNSLYSHNIENISVCDTLSTPNLTPFLGNTEISDVHIYPEGGQLVRGIPSRVAFDINESAYYSAPHYGNLVDSVGNILAEVCTQHEGRGSFVCVPNGTPLYLKFGDKSFSLPKVDDEGCVMSVNAIDSLYISLEIAASPSFVGDTLGLSLLHNGRLISLSSIIPTEEHVLKQFVRRDLSAGVHQLTLFTSEGRILSERLFFVAPREDDISKVNITMPDTIFPNTEISLALHGQPGANISLSVQDYDRRLAPSNGTNLASWYLLTSDLKGFIRNAEYYVEADDAEHRQAADLLMLVQGWRRYSWQQQSGVLPFEKKTTHRRWSVF